MVKHIVFWKLAKENKEENIKKLKTMLINLVGEVPGLIDVEVGLNFNANSEYDITLYSTLADKEALTTYQDHPKHIPIKDFMKNITIARACTDYEIIDQFDPYVC